MKELLDNFIDTSVKTITLENTVFSLKEDIKDRRRLKNSVLDEMDSFLTTVEKTIAGAVARSKEQETILKYSEKSKEFLKKFIEEGKTKFSDEIFREIEEFEKKVDEADEENGKKLELFFISDPIPIINKKYTLKATVEGYSAKVQIDCDSEISSVFEIASSEVPFWDGHVKAYDFVRGVEIPAWMKKTIEKLLPELEAKALRLAEQCRKEGDCAPDDPLCDENRIKTLFRETHEKLKNEHIERKSKKRFH